MIAHNYKQVSLTRIATNLRTSIIAYCINGPTQEGKSYTRSPVKNSNCGTKHDKACIWHFAAETFCLQGAINSQADAIQVLDQPARGKVKASTALK